MSLFLPFKIDLQILTPEMITETLVGFVTLGRVTKPMYQIAKCISSSCYEMETFMYKFIRVKC